MSHKIFWFVNHHCNLNGKTYLLNTLRQLHSLVYHKALLTVKCDWRQHCKPHCCKTFQIPAYSSVCSSVCTFSLYFAKLGQNQNLALYRIYWQDKTYHPHFRYATFSPAENAFRNKDGAEGFGDVLGQDSHRPVTPAGWSLVALSGSMYCVTQKPTSPSSKWLSITEVFVALHEIGTL